MKGLRVCIDARIIDGDPGGIQQFVLGLAMGLSKLDIENEEYFFLTYQDSQDWITPHLTKACRTICLPGPFALSKAKLIFKRIPANWIFMKILGPMINRLNMIIPKSDGTIERAGIHIMHFTTQNGFSTNIPNIYHPHDLLHLHYPQYLPKWVAVKRDMTYRRLCRQATVIATASHWVKEDLKKHYNIPEEKIAVVPLAPLTGSYPSPSFETLNHVKRKFGLPEHFIFYPAQTWPHKNHIGLLKALAFLRDKKGIRIPLVSSGKMNEFFPRIQRKIDELHLKGAVHFLDFVSPLELNCLYKLCRFVVIPTKFEAASFPLWEAFQSGAPVGCSNVTSLPRQAGRAAVVFDPEKTEQIAEAILRLWSDEALRKKLVLRGQKKVQNFNWEKTAKHFRAIYRKISGQPLAEEDHVLMNSEYY